MHNANPAAVERRTARGFTLIEIAICATLLAALLTMLAKTIVAVDANARRSEDRSDALCELENLMERLLANPWERIDDEAIRALSLPAELLRRWPRASLNGAVTQVDDPVAGKRVTLALELGQNARMRPLSLTTWIYRMPRAAP